MMASGPDAKPSRAKPRSRLNAAAVGIALLLASFCGAVIAAELLLRALGIGYGSSPMVASPTLHHAHPRNYTFTVYDPAKEFGGHVVRYDSAGNRVSAQRHARARATTRTIVFLGDSFTEANQVDWPISFVGRVGAADSSVAVVNLGVSSYSPLLYAIQARQTLPQLSPTDVVVQFYANDFADDSTYLAAANSHDPAHVTAVSGTSRGAIIALLRHSYLARLVRRVQLQRSFNATSARPATADSVRGAGDTAVSEPPMPADALLPGTTAWVATVSIAETVRRHQSRLYLMAIPSKRLVKDGRCCAADSLAARTARLASTVGAVFVDLGAAFAAAPAPDQLFFLHDIHLASAGHALVAAELARALSQQAPSGRDRISRSTRAEAPQPTRQGR